MQFSFKDNAFILFLSTTFDDWEPLTERLRRQSLKTSISTKTARALFKGQASKTLPIPRIVNKYNYYITALISGISYG